VSPPSRFRTSEDLVGFTVRLAFARARCGAPQVSPPKERCGEPPAGGARSRACPGRCRHRPLHGCGASHRVPLSARAMTKAASAESRVRALEVGFGALPVRCRPKAPTGGRCTSPNLVMLATPSQCHHCPRACVSSSAAAITDNPCHRAGRLRAYAPLALRGRSRTLATWRPISWAPAGAVGGDESPPATPTRSGEPARAVNRLRLTRLPPPSTWGAWPGVVGLAQVHTAPRRERRGACRHRERSIGADDVAPPWLGQRGGHAARGRLPLHHQTAFGSPRM